MQIRINRIEKSERKKDEAKETAAINSLKLRQGNSSAKLNKTYAQLNGSSNTFRFVRRCLLLAMEQMLLKNLIEKLLFDKILLVAKVASLTCF